MMVQALGRVMDSEGSANPTDPHHTPTITQPSTSQPQKKQPRRKQRKDTKVSQPSGPTEPMADKTKNVESIPTHSNDLLLSGEDSLKLNELIELCTNLQKKVLDLETTKTIQALEIDRGCIQTGEENSCIDADEDITLDSTHVDADPDMFGVHDLHGDEVFVEIEEHVVLRTTTTTMLITTVADWNEDSEVPRTEESRVNQEKDASVNSTNTINTVSPTINAAGIKDNAVDENIVYGCVDDPNMPELEDIVYSDNAEDVGADADMNNLDTFMPVWTLMDLPKGKRAIGTKWVYRNKKDERGIVIKNKARLVAQGYTQEEGIDYDDVFAPIARIEAIRLFLAYASFKDFMVYQIDVKSAFLYGKTEEEVYVCQPPGFKNPDFPDRVYKVDKALYGLHQAPRSWYETLSTYLLDNGFQRGKIDKTLFIKRDKGDILLVQVYVDDIIFGSTKKSLCTEFEKMMHKKFQMSSMGKLTFFLGLQVKQKEDGFFISQDEYVTEILKKFGFSDVKTASTPMETHKPLLKDADGEDVDEHLYRSMIGSLMYLTSSRPDIMFADSPFDLVAYTNSDYAGASLDRKSTTGGCQFLGCRLISWQCKKQNVVANLTTEAEYIAASNCCAQFWDTVKAKTVNGEVQLQALVDKKKVIITESTIRRDLQLEDAEGTKCLPTATIFEELTRMGYEKLTQKLTFYKAFFSPQWKFLIHTILQCLSAKTTAWNEFSSTMASAIICLAINQKFNFSKYIFDSMVKNVDSMVKFWMYPSGPTEPMADETENVESIPTHSNDPLLSGEDSLKLNELKEICTNLQKKVLDLETTKTIQALEIDSLKRRVKKLEKKQKSKTHKLKRLYKVGLSAKVIFSDDEASLGDQEDASKQGRKILDIDADEDITLDSTHFDTDPDMFGVHDLHVSAATATTTTIDELTLAQILIEIKAAKPKVRGVMIQEPSETTITTTTPTASKPSQDKGKVKITKSEKPLKKKDQIMYDQEVSLNLQAQLQAELEEEERLTRQKEEEANIALIESWDNT
ncbi:putative ribonuclease H-like domain-containing protein [Tanacetum coccineum]